VPELRVRASGCDACRGSDKGLSGLCCHLALRLGPGVAGETFFDSTHECQEQGPARGLGLATRSTHSSEWLLSETPGGTETGKDKELLMVEEVLAVLHDFRGADSV
jgi:hypothetical protein